MSRCFLILSFVLQSWAWAETEGETQTPPVPAVGVRQITFDVTSYGMDEKCAGFMKADGSLGPWGESLIKAFERVGTECFYTKADYSAICPKFEEFSSDRRKQFLVFLWAAMSNGHRDPPPDRPKSPDHPEPFIPRCDPTFDSGQGERPIRLSGLMQLEYSQGERRAVGRSRVHCNSPDSKLGSQDLDFQMRCSASMFETIYCREFKPGRTRKVGEFRNTYWLSMRPGELGTEIAKKFPYCQ